MVGKYDAPFVPYNNGVLFNDNSPNFLHWRAALGRVRQGTGRGRLLIAGDSTTAGVGTGTGPSNCTGAVYKNYPSQLASMLPSIIPAAYQSFYSDQNMLAQLGTNTSYPTYDPRVSFGAGWTQAQTTLGGSMFSNSTTTNPLTFTTSKVMDTIEVYSLQNGGIGNFTVNVDGGASLGTVVGAAGGAAIVKNVFTCSKGTHVVNIVPVNNGTIYLGGVITYDSTNPAIDIIHAGWCGGTAANQANTNQPWYGPGAITALTPDLTIVNLSINDALQNTAIATYTAAMQTIITAGQLSGDVMLMVGAPSLDVSSTNGTLDGIVAAQAALAVANGCVMLNLRARWGSYGAVNPVMPYYNQYHPGPVGTSDTALAIFQAISQP